MKENEKIKKADKELETLSGDEYVRRLAFLRDKAIRDEVSSNNIAKKETKLEIAQKMLSMNIDKKIIMEATGLKEEELDNINKQ